MIWSAFKKYTGESLRMAIQRLHALKETVNAEAFDLVEQLYGFNYSRWNILLNPRFAIDCVRSAMFDWAHVYVCNGLADSELGSFMKVMCRTRSTYQEFAQYLMAWTLSRAWGNIKHLFSARSASYLLTKADSTVLRVNFSRLCLYCCCG